MKTQLTIRNCPVEFRFRCPKLWDELEPTGDPRIRHCSACDQAVHLCTTDAETIAHARAGHCIARAVPDDSELPRVVTLGIARPIESTPEQAEAGRWRSREAGIDDSIRNLSRSPRSCPSCTYPALPWRKTCRVCGFEMGRLRPEEAQAE